MFTARWIILSLFDGSALVSNLQHLVVLTLAIDNGPINSHCYYPSPSRPLESLQQNLPGVEEIDLSIAPAEGSEICTYSSKTSEGNPPSTQAEEKERARARLFRVNE
jgi:hypothetical protein